MTPSESGSHNRFKRRDESPEILTVCRSTSSTRQSFAAGIVNGRQLPIPATKPSHSPLLLLPLTFDAAGGKR